MARRDKERERQARLKQDVAEKLGDLAQAPGVEHALVELGLDLLAARHRPAEVSEADFALIRDNYPVATPDLAALRTVDEAGLVTLLSEAIGFARMYLDYSPLSHWKADMVADEGPTRTAGNRLTAGVKILLAEGAEAGISQFGTCALVVLSALQEGLQRGLPWAKAARVAVDALQLAVPASSSAS